MKRQTNGAPDANDGSARRLVVGLAVVAVVMGGGIYVYFWTGVFEFHPEEETFWSLLHQKGHWYFELFISGVETILFNILIGLVGWRYFLKPYITKRQADAVAEDHALHGIEDHDRAV